MSPTEARRTAYSQAKAAGCTCRPDIAYRPSGTVEVDHDLTCPLVDFGQTAALYIERRDGLMPVAIDLTTAIDTALRCSAIVISASDGVMVVPDSIDVPPVVAEWCDITKVTRPNGRVVRVCSVPDSMVAHLAGQMGGAS